MMNKKKDLAGALRAQEEEPGKGSEAPSQTTDAPRTSEGAKASARSGLVNIAGWFPMRVKYELEELRLARRRQTGKKITLQQLQAEAYNDLFKKYGRAEVAPSGD